MIVYTYRFVVYFYTLLHQNDRVSIQGISVVVIILTDFGFFFVNNNFAEAEVNLGSEVNLWQCNGAYTQDETSSDVVTRDH